MPRNQDQSQVALFSTSPAVARPSKTCPKCRLEKPVHDFPVRSAISRRPGSYCLVCQREVSKEHYRLHLSDYRLKRQISQRRVIERNLSKVAEFLQPLHCVDCGEGDTTVLEFDHVKGTKLGDVSKMVHQGLSWARIHVEITKCEVRCANCHRRRTVQVLRERKKNASTTGGSSAW
jgi:hypothetical protein